MDLQDFRRYFGHQLDAFWWFEISVESKYESDEFRFHTKVPYGKPSSGCLNFSNRASTAAAKGPMKPTKGNNFLPCGYPK